MMITHAVRAIFAALESAGVVLEQDKLKRDEFYDLFSSLVKKIITLIE